MALEADIKGTLVRLLNIPSASYEEGELVREVLRILEEKGVEGEIDSNGNIIAALQGQGGKKIILNAHLDTVRGEIPVKMEEGLVYGRGAADMKGGLTGIIEALAVLKNKKPKYDVYFHGVVREEVDGYGTYSLNKQDAKGDLAIIAEPTRLNISLGQKGRVTLKAKIHGKASHASKPELGVNAILNAYEAISRIYKIKTKNHRIIGDGSIAVTTISGGKASNVIPDECLITMDRRLTIGETPELALEQIRKALKGLEGRVYLKERPTPYSTPFLIERNPLIDELHSSVKKFHPCNFGVSRATTDASFYVNSGIPAVIFGPGEPDLAHTMEEHIDPGEVIAFTKALVGFLR